MTRKYRVVPADEVFLKGLDLEPKRNIENLLRGQLAEQYSLNFYELVPTPPSQDHMVLFEGNHDADLLDYLLRDFSLRGQPLRPPLLARFLLLLIPLRQREHILGDLEEEFKTILLQDYGLRWACVYYYWHVSIEVLTAVAHGLKGAVIGYLISKFTK